MRIFDFDSPLMRVLSVIGDIVLLNVLFILTSIPLITIGAASCALFYTADQLQHQEGHLVGTYFQSFKSNFGKSTLYWLALVLISALLLINYQLSTQMPAPLHTIFGILYGAIGVVFLSGSLFIFPLLAKTNCKIGLLIKNAFLLAGSQLPKTLLFLLLFLLPFAVFLFSLDWFFRLIPLWLLGYFALTAGIKAGLLSVVFDKE